jgi:hypothetical protein
MQRKRTDTRKCKGTSRSAWNLCRKRYEPSLLSAHTCSFSEHYYKFVRVGESPEDLSSGKEINRLLHGHPHTPDALVSCL